MKTYFELHRKLADQKQTVRDPRKVYCSYPGCNDSGRIGITPCVEHGPVYRAAPELLATARAVIAAYGRDGVDADWETVLAPLYAAIDKAEGNDA